MSSKEWMPRETWDARYQGQDCGICQSWKGAKKPYDQDEYGFTITNLEVSRLRLVRNQYVPGYCVLIARRHVCELHDFNERERQLFVEDLARAGEALKRAMDALKMNTEILGNQQPHLHAHLVPRYYGDPAPEGPMDPYAQTITLDEDACIQRVGDIREALGMIRVPPADPLLEHYLDEQGRVVEWPPKQKAEHQQAVLDYLVSFFEVDRTYNEREVNDLLKAHHLFEDWAMLRREMFERGMLRREKDGRKYWRTEVSASRG